MTNICLTVTGVTIQSLFEASSYYQKEIYPILITIVDIRVNI